MGKFKVENLLPEQKTLRLRILEVSYKAIYSHIGSCLSSIDLIDVIYRHKKKDEVFVLSNGHAGIALYVVLEKHGLIKKGTLERLNIHPDRNPKLNIHVSTGSLGQGLPIAVGIALADKSKNVYCMISDGECAEGSIWESLRIASELKLDNLKIILNANGWGAYDPINIKNLAARIKAFGLRVVKINGHNLDAIRESLALDIKGKPFLIFAETNVDQLPFLNGQEAHYYIMKKEDYQLALKLLT